MNDENEKPVENFWSSRARAETAWRLVLNKEATAETWQDWQTAALDMHGFSQSMCERYFLKFLKRLHFNPGEPFIKAVIKVLFSIPSKEIHRETIRRVLVRVSRDVFDYLLVLQTGDQDITLSRPETVKPEHIKPIKNIVSTIGIQSIYLDLAFGRNYSKLVAIAETNEELFKYVEKHLISKARRWESFSNLIKFMEYFPSADKKKMFMTVYSKRDTYKGKLALKAIERLPEFAKFAAMK